jgi:hypothetical protein
MFCLIIIIIITIIRSPAPYLTAVKRRLDAAGELAIPRERTRIEGLWKQLPERIHQRHARGSQLDRLEAAQKVRAVRLLIQVLHEQLAADLLCQVLWGDRKSGREKQGG